MVFRVQLLPRTRNQRNADYWRLGIWKDGVEYLGGTTKAVDREDGMT